MTESIDYFRVGQDRAMAAALDPKPGSSPDWTLNDLARFFADGAALAEKRAADEITRLRAEVESLRAAAQVKPEVAKSAAVAEDAARVARIKQSELGATRNSSGLNYAEKALWDLCQRVIDAAPSAEGDTQ